MKTPALALALSSLLLAVAPARADEFDAAAARATPLAGPEALASLFWSQVAQCKDQDDFFRRQCEGIKAARRARIAGSTFLLDARGALTVTPFDAKTMSVDIEVNACAACEGVKIGGERRFLVGRGAVKAAGGKATPVSLHRGARTFSSKAEGETWSKTVAPRLTAQLLLKIPATLEPWKDGGASGYHVEVVGFRVFDPCTGGVLFAQPKSASVAPDSSACGSASKKTK